MSPQKPKRYLTRTQVAERYGKTTRSIARWELDVDLAFPKPLDVNGHKLFAEDDLENWERQRAAGARKAA